jgi:hypothetical protein
MFQVERRLEPNGPFTPVLAGEDNAMFGSRDEPLPDRTIRPGVDLMEVYPEEARPRLGSDQFSYQDVFRAPDETNPSRRDPPPPGSVLRYRVRTLDVIGRPSLQWRESDTARLEKHDPPPLPAAYDSTPADQFTKPGPTGVYARILVRGSSELTPEEATLLGTSDNAILLRWGWRAEERTQDPFAKQFRVYLSPTFDLIPSEILSVADAAGVPGDWKLQVRVPQALNANAAAGLFLNAGYPFFIVEHTDGLIIDMLVRTRIPDANGVFRKPALGPVSVPLKLAPGMTRPQSWSERFTHVPVTAAEQYEAVILDRLLLSPEHPRDTLWVGVTSADSESYVDDTFPDPGPGGPLPGNESPVVAVLCDARRVIRPDFNPPPPAGPVPRILAPEPVTGPVHFTLDLTPHITGLTAGELSQPERVSATELFAALGVSGDQLMALVVNRRDPGESDHPLTFPNPADQASVVNAVRSGASAALEDRLAVQIAAMHPYADRVFRQATPTPVPFGAFDETLPPTEERYVYRYRRADSAQRLSIAAAVVSAVVRVPSLSPGASPQRAPSQAGDPTLRLRLRIPADPRLSHLLTFEHAVIEGSFAGEAELLRVPNRPELAPGSAIRLRLPNGDVVAPSSQPLGSLPSDPEGWLATVDATGPAGQRTMIWASTLTEDGVPAPPSGPWRVTILKPDLAAPELNVVVSASTLTFSWTLSDPLITSVWLEVSGDGIIWERASPVRQRTADSWSISRGPATRQFRLVGSSQDRRRASSNVVVA